MTDKEIFSEIAKWCICSRCKHKRTLSYKPIRDNNEEIIGYEDIRSACYKRTPFSEPSKVDGKIGIHSLPVPEENCIFFEKREDNDILDLVFYLEENNTDVDKILKKADEFYAKDAEEFDNLIKNNNIEDIIKF